MQVRAVPFGKYVSTIEVGLLYVRVFGLVFTLSLEAFDMRLLSLEALAYCLRLFSLEALACLYHVRTRETSGALAATPKEPINDGLSIYRDIDLLIPLGI